MKYINYFLLFLSSVISIFLFFVSANQIELVPNKNEGYKGEQIMQIEKSNDLHFVKNMAETSVEKYDVLYNQLSDFAAKMNTWIVLLFIIQLAMGVLFFLQFRKNKIKNPKSIQD